MLCKIKTKSSWSQEKTISYTLELFRHSPGPLYSNHLKRLKFYVTGVDPHILHRKFLSVPWNRGKYSATNIGQIAIHQFILDNHTAFTWWLCNKQFSLPSLWLMIAAITAVTRMDTPEGLSVLSVPVLPLVLLCGTSQSLETGASLGNQCSYMSDSLGLKLWVHSGNKEAREGTAIFLIRHSSKRSHFDIFEHCVRCYAHVVHRVLSASCVVSMQRRI